MKLKGLNEVVYSMINNIHDKLPNVDIKEGTFIRDVFINPVSQQIAQMYQDMQTVEYAQSILTSTGDSLDRLAANYFLTRSGKKRSTGRLRIYIATDLTGRVPKPELDVDFVLPRGSSFYTKPSNTENEIYFQTIYSFEYYKDSEISSLQYDVEGQQLYFEVDAESIIYGSETNVGEFTITQLTSGLPRQIVSVTNIMSFSGGSDGEDDASLSARIGMAILGSNVGTTEGYRNFMLKQKNVSDVVVVGAGHSLMKRDRKRNEDGSVDYLDKTQLDKKYFPVGTYDDYFHVVGVSENNTNVEVHQGGMVDVYVRVNQYEESKVTMICPKDKSSSDEKAILNIVLPNQPVVSIQSIIGKRNIVREFSPEDIVGEPPFSSPSPPIYTETELETTMYYNESNYDFELNGKEKMFFEDIPWTFIDPIGDTGKDMAIKAVNYLLKETYYLMLTEISLAPEYIPITGDKLPNTDNAILQGGNVEFNEDENTWEETYVGGSNPQGYDDAYFEHGGTRLNNNTNSAQKPFDVLYKLRLKPDVAIQDENGNPVYSNIDEEYEKIVTAELLDEDGQPYVFVKKNGKIHHRKYTKAKPSFRLQKYNNYSSKDNEPFVLDFSGSIKASDSIEWTNQGENPQPSDELIITYTYNKTISDLQSLIDKSRVLTADVLVKEARPVKVKIVMQIIPYEEYTFDEARVATINKIKKFIDTFKGMGAKLDLSSLVSIVKVSDEIKYVDVENTFMYFLEFDPNANFEGNDNFNKLIWKRRKSKKLSEIEFFEIYDIYISAISEEQFLGGE